MVTSEVELCNHALSLLGESRIADFTEATEKARLCSLFYDQTRDELLADYEWPFAMHRKALSAVDEENLTAWDYAYALPNDLITMYDVLDEINYHRVITVGYGLQDYDIDMRMNSRRIANPINSEAFYSVESDRLYTNFSPCYVRYVRRLTTVTKFPEPFVSALALAIAAKLAPRLTQNMNMAQSFASLAQNALVVAKSKVNTASRPRAPVNTLWTEYH